MATERTFSIIKPDATRRNLTGAITAKLEEAGLRVVASRRIRMSREQAEGFYGVHRERPFFNDLVTFMTSGPVVVQVLEGGGLLDDQDVVLRGLSLIEHVPQAKAQARLDALWKSRSK